MAQLNMRRAVLTPAPAIDRDSTVPTPVAFEACRSSFAVTSFAFKYSAILLAGYIEVVLEA